MTDLRPPTRASWLPDAERAMRKELAIAPEYHRFVRRFEAHFGFTPVWVAPVEGYGRSFVGIVIERSMDRQMFRPRYSVDWSLPVADRTFVAEWAGGVDLNRSVRRLLLPVLAEPLFLDFEEAMRREVHDRFSSAEMEDWVGSLCLGGQFVRLLRPGGEAPVVVVRTGAVLRTLRDAGALEEWADRYYFLVRGRDEFGYLDRADISIRIESEEELRRPGSTTERSYYM